MTRILFAFAGPIFLLFSGCERSAHKSTGSASGQDALIQEAEQAAQIQITQPAAVMQQVKVPPKDKYTIGFSQCTVVEPWRVQMNKDVQTAVVQHANLQV